VPKVLIMRTNLLEFDTRLNSILEGVIGTGYEYLLLDWQRQKGDGAIQRINQKNRKTLHFSAKYGRSWRNLVGFSFFGIWALSNACKYKPDLIIACDLDAALVGHLYVRGFSNSMMFMDEFDSFPKRVKSPLLRIFAKLLDHKVKRNIQALITPSEERIEIVFASKTKVIPNFQNFKFQHIKSEMVDFESSRYLFYGGSLLPGRNLEAVVLIFTSMPSIELWIAGFGPLDSKLRSIARGSKNIRFLGAMEHLEMMAVARGAIGYFAFYDQEFKENTQAAPNKLYEAAALRIPIISNWDTPFSWAVNKYGIGHLVDIKSPVALEKLLSTIEKENLALSLDFSGFLIDTKKENASEMYTKLILENLVALHEN
jgi:glycosyltransferase involved in cell wall biosynthesis